MVEKILLFAALGEGAFGLLLTVAPVLVARLLLAIDVSGAAIMVGRLAGIGLITLGVVCWPRGDSRTARNIMLTWSVLAFAILVVIGLRGSAGVLLWPAVVVHGAIAVLLVVAGRSRSLDAA